MSEELTTLEFTQGLLTLIFVIITTIIGLIIMLRYLEYKKIDFLLVGAAWILVISPYWPDAITFVLILTKGEWLPDAPYFFIANAIVPFVAILWGFAMSNLIFQKNKKIMNTIFVIFWIAFEGYVLTLWFLDYRLIGQRQSAFVVEWDSIIDLFLLISIGLFLITGLLFAWQSLSSQNEEIKLKGKFLLCAFIFFALGTTIDVAFEISQITIFLARLFVILASILFYIGFTMPKFIKKALVK